MSKKPKMSDTITELNKAIGEQNKTLKDALKVISTQDEIIRLSEELITAHENLNNEAKKAMIILTCAVIVLIGLLIYIS